MTHLKELLSKHKYLMRRGVPWSWGHMNDGQSWYRLPCAAGRGGWRDLLREIASLLWDLAGFSPEGLGGAASTRGSSAAEKHSHIPNSSVTCVLGHKFTFISKVCAWSRKYSIPVGMQLDGRIYNFFQAFISHRSVLNAWTRTGSQVQTEGK